MEDDKQNSRLTMLNFEKPTMENSGFIERENFMVSLRQKKLNQVLRESDKRKVKKVLNLFVILTSRDDDEQDEEQFYGKMRDNLF